jgi:hypothetical protein
MRRATWSTSDPPCLRLVAALHPLERHSGQRFRSLEAPSGPAGQSRNNDNQGSMPLAVEFWQSLILLGLTAVLAPVIVGITRGVGLP